MSVSPELGRFRPPTIAGDAEDEGDRPPDHPARRGLRRLLAEPAVADRPRPRAPRRTSGPTARTPWRDRRARCSRLPWASVAELAPGEVLGRADRPDAVAGGGAPPRSRRPLRARPRSPTFFFSPSISLSWRNAISPRLARSRSAVVSERRDGAAGEDERAGGRRQVARRTGHVDRRVVEVDRVAAVAQPGEARRCRRGRGRPPAPRSARRRRRPGGRAGGVWACSGVAFASTCCERDEQRPVEVAAAGAAAACPRRRSAASRRCRGTPPGSPGRRTGSPGRARGSGHVEQDHEPVVEALPADAPLVHQRLGVGCRPRRS